VAGIGLVLFDLVVIAAWLLWARRGGTRLPLLPRRRRSPLWLVVLALEVIALAKLAKILGHRAAAARHAPVVAGHPGGGHGHGAHLFLPPGSSWPLLVGLALAAIAAGMLMAPRRRRRPQPPAQPSQEPEAPLLAALTAGAGVLHADADPRAAIVNCYAVMEDSLAAAGSPPAAADTPAEVLARASAGGLLRSAAADTLTGLFRRARYSTLPVTEADRTTARDALGRLRAELEGRA
jgi:hypothetical protein